MNINKMVPTITLDIPEKIRAKFWQASTDYVFERKVKDELLQPAWSVAYYKHTWQYKRLIKQSSKTF